MTIKVLAECDISDEIGEKIKESLCICFPENKDNFSSSRYWAGEKPEFSVVGFENRNAAAHIAVIQREIEVGTVGRLQVFGIQNVFVLPEYRGRGTLAGIMKEVLGEIKKRGYTYGLLFCYPKLEGVYVRYGWKKLVNSDIIKLDDNGKKVPFGDKGIAMYYNVEHSGFPAGRIDLMGKSW